MQPNLQETHMRAQEEQSQLSESQDIIKAFLAKVTLAELATPGNALEDLFDEAQLRHHLEDFSFQRRILQEMKTVELVISTGSFQTFTKNLIFIRKLTKEICEHLFQDYWKNTNAESSKRFSEREAPFSFIWNQDGNFSDSEGMRFFAFLELPPHLHEKDDFLREVFQNNQVSDALKELLTQMNAHHLNTLLWVACCRNHEAIVEILINDPRINLKIDQEIIAREIKIACDHRNIKMLKNLLKKNQNPLDGDELLQHVGKKNAHYDFIKALLPLIFLHSDKPIHPYRSSPGVLWYPGQNFIHTFCTVSDKVDPELIFAFLTHFELFDIKMIMSLPGEFYTDIFRDRRVLQCLMDDFPRYLQSLEFVPFPALQRLKKNLEELRVRYLYGFMENFRKNQIIKEFFGTNPFGPDEDPELYASAEKHPFFHEALTSWFKTMQEKTIVVEFAALSELVVDEILQTSALTSQTSDKAVEQMLQKTQSFFSIFKRLNPDVRDKLVLTCVGNTGDTINSRYKQASYDTALRKEYREKKQLSIK